tara:strand:+ start:505 stop:1014 length:510 start_codon:yes stop_codon:yes gene_type:complete
LLDNLKLAILRALESRKFQLQKQIIEALKAKDNDLYSLLKSQWAHRFGVESLEELKNLDLKDFNQNSTNLDNQKIHQAQEKSFDGYEAMSLDDDKNEVKEIKTKEIQSIDQKDSDPLEIKSYEKVEGEITEKKSINSINHNKSQMNIEALIPLPPKPKYGYLKKWVLKK